jgi:hypothetical protein
MEKALRLQDACATVWSTLHQTQMDGGMAKRPALNFFESILIRIAEF